MPRVGTATAKNALVALPPLDEQKRIVEKLESLFAKIDTIQKSIDEVSQLGASLEKQLLQSSISGKLVPQLDEELEVEQIGDAPEEVPLRFRKMEVGTIRESWNFIFGENAKSRRVDQFRKHSIFQNFGYELL